MYFRQLEVGPMANYAYLIGDPGKRECAVVDPAWDMEAIARAAEQDGYRIKAAIATHNHFDHVNGLPALLEKFDVPVHAHKEDAPALKAAGANLRPARSGDRVSVGGLEIVLLHTPGHTSGSQCLQVQDRLLTGDTLFVDGCGRVDLPTSDPEKMYESLRKIARLPSGTVVWPGHNYAEDKSSSLADQIASNLYLKTSSTASLQDFLRLVGA